MRHWHVFLLVAAALYLSCPLPANAQNSETCDTSISSGYTKRLTAQVNGAPLTLQVSARFGGAIDSLVWNGKEFINAWDHGRQLQYAWSFNDYGECLNPTEAGSQDDLQSATSTSRLLAVCSPAPNLLTTVSIPAYWTAPGERGFCPPGVRAKNTSLRSDNVLSKSVEIGYAGLENVIRLKATILVSQSAQAMQIEAPTGYLTYEFTSFWYFDPRSRALTAAPSMPLTNPDPLNTFISRNYLPPILATPDGKYAMGAYSMAAFESYDIMAFLDPKSQGDSTNKWSIIVRQENVTADTYSYEAFVIVGTLSQVEDAMQHLYAIHPGALSTPRGYVDVVNCNLIAGWAWDPVTPDQALKVEVYRVDSQGTETLVASDTANHYRDDLIKALGSSGYQGYEIPLPPALRDGNPITLRVYALSSVPQGGRRLLSNSNPPVTCH